MVTLEQVEKLRERAGISYEESKKALEETNGDLLEAVINLEKQNRIQAPKSGGYYHSKEEKQETEDNGSSRVSEVQSKKTNRCSFGETMGNFFQWCGEVLHKGNTNSLEVVKDGQNVMVVSLTVFALFLIFAFWLVLPLIIIGLIFRYRFKFKGPDLGKTEVNRAMDNVSDATVRAVDTVVDAAKNFSKDINKNKGENKDGENSDH
ncbi:DUF4342 domain-containing protein [Candidatus Contubernalis alkalaceticus]|nr:DUF4342 domain-containing protein [Candidatus Contubernalis alkalaceticus]